MNRPGGKSVIITLRGGLPVDLTAIRRHLTGASLSVSALSNAIQDIGFATLALWRLGPLSPELIMQRAGVR
jgi:antitoxin (DNA-binding transcriptional repressor) of toxin-antitoxin stability system